MSDPRLELAATLRQRQADIEQLNITAGFDGFVDEMIKIVAERTSLDDFEPVPTIANFSDIMAAAAGRSSLREIVVTDVAAGGCSVNLGDGIMALGAQLDYFGTLGTPRNAAFDEFAGPVPQLYGVGPGTRQNAGTRI